jgi:hypothetical protein
MRYFVRRVSVAALEAVAYPRSVGPVRTDVAPPRIAHDCRRGVASLACPPATPACFSGGALPGPPAYRRGVDPRRDLGCSGDQRRQAKTALSRNASGTARPVIYRNRLAWCSFPGSVAPACATELMETSMRLRYLVWLSLPVFLAGCGGGDKPASTVSVSCGGTVALAGARTVDVLGDPVNGKTTLSFPDPANPGQTGTLIVPPHDRCSISPTAGSGG